MRLIINRDEKCFFFPSHYVHKAFRKLPAHHEWEGKVNLCFSSVLSYEKASLVMHFLRQWDAPISSLHHPDPHGWVYWSLQCLVCGWPQTLEWSDITITVDEAKAHSLTVGCSTGLRIVPDGNVINAVTILFSQKACSKKFPTSSQPALGAFCVSVRLCSHRLSRVFRSNPLVFTNKTTVFGEPLLQSQPQLSAIPAGFHVHLNSLAMLKGNWQQDGDGKTMCISESAEGHSNNKSANDQALP